MLRSRFSDCQIFAHFFEALRAQAANRQQIVHALERAIGLVHLHNLVRRRRPDPRHQLQQLRIRRIDVRQLRRRLFLSCNRYR